MATHHLNRSDTRQPMSSSRILRMAGKGVERGHMNKWGEWWADCQLFFWWLAIAVIGGELLSFILREVSF
jgi:hypothetical protein